MHNHLSIPELLALTNTYACISMWIYWTWRERGRSPSKGEYNLSFTRECCTHGFVRQDLKAGPRYLQVTTLWSWAKTDDNTQLDDPGLHTHTHTHTHTYTHTRTHTHKHTHTNTHTNTHTHTLTPAPKWTRTCWCGPPPWAPCLHSLSLTRAHYLRGPPGSACWTAGNEACTVIMKAHCLRGLPGSACWTAGNGACTAMHLLVLPFQSVSKQLQKIVHSDYESSLPARSTRFSLLDCRQWSVHSQALLYPVLEVWC